MEVNFNKEEAKPSPQTIIPANAPARRVTETTRVPMSLPTLKLAVPEVPGFFLYWHLGKNVPSALRAGYTFVDGDEVTPEQKNVANGADESGSTDMGTRISIASGDNDVEAERLYLMKLPDEWRAQDQAKMTAVNESLAKQMREGSLGRPGEDMTNRKVKAGQDLFIPRNLRR